MTMRKARIRIKLKQSDPDGSTWYYYPERREWVGWYCPYIPQCINGTMKDRENDN